jgi:hypothetical protein
MLVPDSIRQPLIILLKAITAYLEDPYYHTINHNYHYHCTHPGDIHIEDCRPNICTTPNCRYQAA